MRSLDITKANLDNQRNAVQEERRLGVDNQPYGRTFEVRDELAFDNPAYEHSVIGSMADLSAATVDDVSAFFKTYYAPNNAVLSIVGDVDSKATLEKVRKYFESIPSQPAPPAVDITEPPQTEERRTTIEDPLARLTRLDMVYKTPPSAVGRRRCAARAGDGPLERAQLALLRGHRASEAAGAERLRVWRREPRARRSSALSEPSTRGRPSRISRRRSTPRSSG